MKWLALLSGVSAAAASKMTLVETIPLIGMDELALAPGAVHTWEAQKALCDGAERTLDISMMYENLLVESDAAYAAWYARNLTALGADRGAAVFAAIVGAQSRGVKVRVLASPMGDTANCTLVRTLRATPALFEYAEWNPEAWYGGGIMHMKLWIADRVATYVGSANMDWASLAQVKEIGALVEDAAVADDASRLFDTFWAMASCPVDAEVAPDPRIAHARRVPSWSANVVPEEARRAFPFPHLATPWNLRRPLEGSGFDSSLFLAAAPPEVVGGAGRMEDADAIVATVDDAEAFVGLAVMDYMPASAYNANGTVYSWPAFGDAALRAVSPPARKPNRFEGPAPKERLRTNVTPDVE